MQDAYALRCAPQVHGAARDAIGFARRLAEIEANARPTTPWCSRDDGDIVSGGNFHGAPIALAADTLAIGVTQLASISERRLDRLMTSHESGLPAFLVRECGINSGLMMAQVTAAALTSEMKTLTHPASADSIPTSAGREDHVSMSMGAALKAAAAVELATTSSPLSSSAACQGIDLLAPLTILSALARVQARCAGSCRRIVDRSPPSADIAHRRPFIVRRD